MKRNRISLILLSLLILTSIVGIFSMNGLGQPTDLNYNFERNEISVEGDELIFDEQWNIKNSSSFTGIYNATFSFTDDEIGSIPNGWVDTSGTGTYSNITTDINGHDNVLRLFDNENLLVCEIGQTFSGQNEGIIEFWWRVSDNEQRGGFFVRDGSTTIMRIYSFETRFWRHYAGGATDVLAIIEDKWYHHKIEFDCGTDTWDWYINGVNYLMGGAFDSVSDTVDNLLLNTRGGDFNYYNYFDAIGYSWDVNYTIGNNMIPYQNISQTMLEIDTFEFDFKGVNELYDTGDDNPSGWTDVEVNGDVVNMVPDQFYGMAVEIVCADGLEDYEGITRDFDTHGQFVNITCRFRIIEYDSTHGQFFIDIYSYDDTLIARLQVDDNLFQYHDGVGWNQIYDSLVEDVWYYVTILLHYEIDLAIINFYVGTIFPYDPHVLDSTNMWVLWDTGKEGLGDVNLFGFGGVGIPATDFEFMIDLTGVYVNDTSLSDEMAWMFADFVSWNLQNQNIFEIIADGEFTIGLGSGDYIPETSPFGTLQAEAIYYNNLTVYNYYDTTVVMEWLGAPFNFDENTANPRLIIFFSEGNEGFNITNVEIHGVKLIEGSNIYYLTYTHGNIDIDESYFYVDSNNRLRGQCLYNDSDLEYIQANFDINNVLAENRSLRFRGHFSGQYGFFGLNYIDASSTSIPLPIGTSSYNLILPQEKTIEEFVFLITDDDELEAGYGSGSIYEIELTWNPSISITIVTISLIMIIIPLIIMIVPTLTLYSRYGKSVIMPVFIFMSIICFAGGLIPAWLFFILMIGAGGFLVLKKRSDE